MSITVIIPTTNERNKYHNSIYKNYISQTYTNKKLIVYEDGNDTKPSNFWENKSKQHIDITYIHSDIKHTIGHKRNEMIEKSTTEYIAHFDDDDIYLPTYLEHMIKEIGDCYLCKLTTWLNYTSDSFIFRDRLQLLKIDKNGGAFYYRKHNLTEDETHHLHFGFSYIYKKSIYPDIKYDNVCFNEDTPFAEKIRNKYKIKLIETIEEPRVIHIQHTGNTSLCHPNYNIPESIKKYIKKLSIRNNNSLQWK
jgi:glycosyltransferase involved in cell wall biosynthesis